MSRLKSSKPLEVLAKERVAYKFRTIISNWIRRLQEAGMRGRRSWLNEVSVLEDECVQLNDYLFSKGETIITDEIVTMIIKIFSEMIGQYHQDNGRPRLCIILCETKIHKRICLMMLRSVLLPTASVCDITAVKSKFVQGLLLDSLRYLSSGVTCLILPGELKEKYMTSLLNNIEYFPRLIDFQFEYGCTVEVVEQLGIFCKNLKKLTVHSSVHLNDDCIEHILKLKELVALDISETSITDQGYSQLLSGLPKLKNITWFHTVDNILMQITTEKLYSISHFIGKVSDPDIVTRFCPNITNLTLLDVKRDVIKINELEKVHHFHVINSNAVIINLNSVLQNLGKRITVLEMMEVDDISLNTIITNCDILKIFDVNMSSFISLNKDIKLLNTNLQHFKSVSELYLNHIGGNLHICKFIGCYTNLKKLHVSHVRDINDITLYSIIRRDGLGQLTELIIENCGPMHGITLWTIIRHCRNLKTLGNLSNWHGVTENEITAVLAYFKVLNVDINVEL